MVKFIDYLNKCLENPEFRKYWEEDELAVKEDNLEEYSLHDIFEKLNSLTEDNLSDIIKNKGIKAPTPNTTIEFYEVNNKCPVEDFLESISNQKLKEKTLRNIYELSLLGRNARPPLSAHIRDGVFELRTKQSSNIDRIFYFFVFGNKIIMTNGYIKDKQKMDEEEFNRAKEYMNEYLNRNNK